MREITIADRPIGDRHPVFIIAEIGINHNGSIEVARQIIDMAHMAGADAAKFQKRHIPAVYTKEELSKPREIPRALLENALKCRRLPEESVRRLERTGFTETTNGDQKWMLEFGRDDYVQIFEHCAAKDMLCFASPWDSESVAFMERFNPPCYKIASASATDDELLLTIKETGRPVILSTGGCNLPMIRHAVSVLGTENLAILHCTACYIKPVLGSEEVSRMVNLRAIQTLRDSFPTIPIGFSSHYSGVMPAIHAVTLGASIVETHVTLERSMYGSDHASSLEPHEFRNMCQSIREFDILQGDGNIHIYSQEVETMKKLRRVWSPDQAKLFAQSQTKL